MHSNSIFLTNVNGTDDNVMVFTDLTAEELEAAYRAAGGKITFDECYAVPEKDQQFYIWEPCWLSKAEENYARKLITKVAA